MPPFTTPALPVLTDTVMPLLLVAPATRPLTLPLPEIRLAPVPCVAPKLASRSSTKPDGPLAEFRIDSVRLTFCPTCTVPKSSGADSRLPAATW